MAEEKPEMSQPIPLARFGPLVLFILVFGFLVIVANHGFGEWERHRKQVVEQRFQQRITRFLRRYQPREYFMNRFLHLRALVERKRYNEQALRQFRPALLPSFAARLSVYSPKGAFLNLPWGNLGQPKVILQKLWDDLQNQEKPDGNVKMYRSLFGPSFSYRRFFEMEDVLIDIGKGPDDGLLIYHRGPDNAGVILHTQLLPDLFSVWQDLFQGRRQRQTLPKTSIGGSKARVSRSIPGQKIFLAAWDPERQAAITWGPSWRGWRNVLLSGQYQADRTLWGHHRVVRILRTPDNLTLLVSAPHRLPNFRRRQGQMNGLFLALGLLGVVFPATRGGVLFSRIPLFARLLAFFLFSLAVPLALIISMSVASFREQAIRDREDLHEANLRRLRTLDASYQNHRVKVLNSFRSLRDSPAIRNKKGRAVNRTLKALIRQRKIVSGAGWDSNGQPLFAENIKSEATRMLTMFVQEMLGRYLNIRNQRAPTPIDELGKQVLVSLEMGMGWTGDHPDQLIPFSMGQNGITWFWDVFPPMAGSHLSFISLMVKEFWLKDSFLRQVIKKGSWAYNHQSCQWYPEAPRGRVFQDLLADLLIHRKTAQLTGRLNGEPMLISAFPSTAVPGFSLFTATSLVASDTRIRTQQLTFYALLAGILAVVWLFARFARTIFLTPIQVLDRSLQTFEKRQLSFRVPDLGTDEFGQVGRALDTMMQEMHEVDMARKVQDSLIPKILPVIPGYDVALRYFPLTNLAGDYTDVLKRPDGQVGLLIGDVAGHGIGSAVVAAMAKATCFQSMNRNDSMEDMLMTLNSLLFHTVNRKRPLTFFSSLLDPDRHTWTWANNGHNYPYFRMPNGELKSCRMPGYPMGFRKTVAYREETWETPPGAMGLLYTDGLIEAASPEGKPFDYGRVEQIIREFGHLPSEAFLEELMKQFADHTRLQPLNDDVTVLVFRRRP